MHPDGIPLCQGATDSEKRVQHLTLENEALKQSLSLTRELLLHWGPGPLSRAPQVLCCLAVWCLQSKLLYAWYPVAVLKPPQDFVCALVGGHL